MKRREFVVSLIGGLSVPPCALLAVKEKRKKRVERIKLAAVFASICGLLLTSCGEGPGNVAVDSNRPFRVEPPTSDEPTAAFELLLNDPLANETPKSTADSVIGQRLIELIDSAEQSVDFAIYGIRDQADVLQALRSAQERGVIVRGVVDRNLAGENYYSGA